ncbi:hypothetical protein AKJ09_07233 [Labilithrix luteola]|uniref:Tetratricopeptide repeat protein n=1 Tax=Labilithrix luteola TaxID=1391654 RepID=A0A0K1Q586_9BACT|nr:hypothetical protein AKJ09_07233 [Labilithrix luteola]
MLRDFAKANPLSPADEPLRKPKSLADVDAILHLDQLDLFGGAAAFAEKQSGTDALVLGAQVELSWSEAQLIVAEVLDGAVENVSEATRTLRFRHLSGATSDAEQAKLAELENAEREAKETSLALRELAGEHARRGAELTRKLISASPESFKGYRIAADYHRLRGDWGAFNEALTILEQKNPTSTGLLFLRALQAQSEGDPIGATQLLRKALQKDPKFVRAQAHLVLLQRSPEGAHQELEKLRALNPRHQIIAFTGPLIDAAYEQWRARRVPPSGPRGANSI